MCEARTMADLQEAHDVAGAIVPEVVVWQRQLLNGHCTFDDAFCKSLDVLSITTPTTMCKHKCVKRHRHATPIHADVLTWYVSL